MTPFMLRPNQLDADRAMTLVIDVQEKLLPLIDDHRRIVSAGCKLLEGGRPFRLPVLATEQYPEGLGPTDGTLKACLDALDATILTKSTFSAWAEPDVRAAMLRIDRPQVIVMGVETHVCVQQTALDLVSRDYEVFVCADAAGSRSRLDESVALDRMRHAGVAVTTVESVLFELCGRCDTREFKEMLSVIKKSTPDSG